MLAPDWLLPSLILVPLATALAATFLSRSRPAQGWLALAAVGVLTILALWQATVFAGGGSRTAPLALGEAMGMRFELALAVDPLSALFVLLLILPALANVAFNATRADVTASRPYQEPVVFLSLAMALATVVSGNPLTLYVFWQLAILCFALLVISRADKAAFDGAARILAFGQLAALLILLAAGWSLLDGSGTARWPTPAAGPAVREAITGLLVAAGLVGAAVAPLHTGYLGGGLAAPPAVASYFAGTLNRLGLYVLCRAVLLNANGLPPEDTHTLIALFGALTALVLGFDAVFQAGPRRATLTAAASQVGVALIGLGLGGLTFGASGALYLLLGQAIGLPLILLSIEETRLRAGDGQPVVGGLGARLPLAALGFAVGAATILGPPPFPGFLGQALAYEGLFSPARGWHPLLAVAGLAGSLLAAAALVRAWVVVFLGAERSEGRALAPGNGLSEVTLVVLIVLCLGLALLPNLALTRLVAPATGAVVLDGWGGFGAAIRGGADPARLWVSAFTLIVVLLPLVVGAAARALRGRYPGREGPAMPPPEAALKGWLATDLATVPQPVARGFATAQAWLAEGTDLYAVTRLILLPLSRFAAWLVRLTSRLLVR